MSSIEWIQNGRSVGDNKKSVSVTIQKYRTDKKSGKEIFCTSIMFRNNSWEQITNGDYLGVGLDEGAKRICFKEGLRSGFKLSKEKSGTRFIRIPRVLRDYVGDYDIHQANDDDYSYIKREDLDEQ